MPIFKYITNPKSAAIALLWPLLIMSNSNTQAIGTSQQNTLPSLGDSASAVVSPKKEHELGRIWLRGLRRQTQTSRDPLLQDYIEHLIYRLAASSQVTDRRFEIVIVNSPQMNAFAVPGGVIGINNGLFTYAHNEHEFASVLAHELAHLSQRHFARNIEAMQNSQIPSLVALLGSVLLAASGAGEAAMATMTATQGASMENQLRFSRQNEQEADRIGILNLAHAEMDPFAMPAMFQRMQEASRYYSRPPEFLLSHPVTESRISDSLNRAEQYPRKHYDETLEFHLMRARVRLHFANKVTQAIEQFESELKNKKTLNEAASRYALAIAYTKNNQLSNAENTLAPLLKADPHHITFNIAQANIELKQGKTKQAEQRLKQQLSFNPGNYPLNMSLAVILKKQQKYNEAVELLKQYIKNRPNDPAVWYLLSETAGQADNILLVHQSRAEYFLLHGNYQGATEQLYYARNLAKENYPVLAKIDQRLKDIQLMKKDLSF